MIKNSLSGCKDHPLHLQKVRVFKVEHGDYICFMLQINDSIFDSSISYRNFKKF